jgi:hypothetical protein
MLVRVWQPSRVPGEKAEERQAMNNLRTGCIVALRAEFGPAFVGGIALDNFSSVEFPDLVVDADLTRKSAFLARLRSTDIGVSTAGLRGSIGWSVAEFTAASLAVVVERPRFEVPGAFVEGKNFLAYTTPDECVAAVRRLVDDPALTMALKAANHAYYQAAVRPDALIRRVVDLAVGLE